MSSASCSIAVLTGQEALITNGNAKDASIHQLESEVSMLREELRINGDRMQRIERLVQSQEHPAEIWSRRKARQHRRRGAIP